MLATMMQSLLRPRVSFVLPDSQRGNTETHKCCLKGPLPCLSVVCRCADYVLLNKIDMLGSENLDSLTAIVSSLNRLAEVS